MKVKNKMLLLASAGMILMANGCKSTMYNNKFVNPDVAMETIIYPGVAGSPTTHHLVVKAEIKNSGTIEMDSFWANGYTDQAFVVDANNKKLKDNKVSKGDIVQFYGYYYVLPAREETDPVPHIMASSSREAKPAVEHKGKMLLRFKINGKVQYLSIAKIEKAPTVYGE